MSEAYRSERSRPECNEDERTAKIQDMTNKEMEDEVARLEKQLKSTRIAVSTEYGKRAIEAQSKSSYKEAAELYGKAAHHASKAGYGRACDYFVDKQYMCEVKSPSKMKGALTL